VELKGSRLGSDKGTTAATAGQECPDSFIQSKLWIVFTWSPDIPVRLLWRGSPLPIKIQAFMFFWSWDIGKGI